MWGLIQAGVIVMKHWYTVFWMSCFPGDYLRSGGFRVERHRSYSATVAPHPAERESYQHCFTVAPHPAERESPPRPAPAFVFYVSLVDHVSAVSQGIFRDLEDLEAG